MDRIIVGLCYGLAIGLMVGNYVGQADAEQNSMVRDKKDAGTCEGVPYRNLQSGKIVCFTGKLTRSEKK